MESMRRCSGEAGGTAAILGAGWRPAPDRPRVGGPRPLIAGSLVAGVYEKKVDRESAYEKLTARIAAAPGATAPAGGASAAPGTTATPPVGADAAGGGILGGLKDVLFGSTGPRGGKHEGLAEAAARSAVRTIGSSVGREIIRGVLGGILGGSSRRG
jgi:hypothetical protein